MLCLETLCWETWVHLAQLTGCLATCLFAVWVRVVNCPTAWLQLIWPKSYLSPKCIRIMAYSFKPTLLFIICLPCLNLHFLFIWTFASITYWTHPVPLPFMINCLHWDLYNFPLFNYLNSSPISLSCVIKFSYWTMLHVLDKQTVLAIFCNYLA